jgi:hypothetical protein
LPCDIEHRFGAAAYRLNARVAFLVGSGTLTHFQKPFVPTPTLSAGGTLLADFEVPDIAGSFFHGSEIAELPMRARILHKAHSSQY